MNLAEAIRRATRDAVSHPQPSGPQVFEIQSAAVVYQMPASVSEGATVVDEHFEHLEDVEDNSVLDELTPEGFIRIELHVPPEQLNRVLRSVVATQNSVLTLREAAHHLRISSVRLEELAKSGEIPGFLVDGKWRFSRSRLDSLQTSESSEKEHQK